mmetsp:Transcript_72218/g.165687  ORF Transcript_72218/g.165687 Transcript_72218/m.165687 type:complete len:85 (-) Transcript_72218:908-1162(-)
MSHAGTNRNQARYPRFGHSHYQLSAKNCQANFDTEQKDRSLSRNPSSFAGPSAIFIGLRVMHCTELNTGMNIDENWRQLSTAVP